MTTKTIYVPQPDPNWCQSACIAMVYVPEMSMVSVLIWFQKVLLAILV
jgi:hypothetical protein